MFDESTSPFTGGAAAGCAGCIHATRPCGGGGIGYGFGEVGLRVRVRGNGDTGSVFLTPSLGYADVYSSVCVDSGYRDIPCYSSSVHQSGPMVGFGVEYRW